MRRKNAPIAATPIGPSNHHTPDPSGDVSPCYVYMVQCRDGSLYTGWTTDLDQRIRAHNEGRGAKYTRSRRPVTLVYRERVPDRSAALKREAAIKKLSRAQKESLLQGAHTHRR